MRDAKNFDLDRLVYDGAIKLEITAGVPTWEIAPGTLHQHTIDLIRASIAPIADNDECECRHIYGVTTLFKDGSLKQPDIAIFCKEPPDQDDPLTAIPQVIIEVINSGFEYKDLYLNPKFYLSQGVRDVVIVDPRSGAVTHYRKAGVANHHAPVTLDLLCGCRCTIPE